MNRFIAAVVFYLALATHALAQTANESGGVAVFEAENYTANLSPRTPTGGVAHSWTLGSSQSGYSGSGYMEATPNVGPPGGNADANSPQLQFTVNFNFSGPGSGTSNVAYYIWVRAYGATTNDDSLYVGIDGGNAVAMTMTQNAVWQWSNAIQGGATSGAKITVPTSGNHTINVWMREDGIKLDKILLTSNATFSPTTGNVWHIPDHAEPASVVSMRSPFTDSLGNDVTIWTGNQYQGSGTPGNQLTTGSAVFWKKSTDTNWQSVAMSFDSAAGNNKYYKGMIPSASFVGGDAIQYYIRIPYSDHLPTFLYGDDATSHVTEIETSAQATPYSFVVQDFNYWQGQSIYQIITDRFFNGDISNDNAEGNYAPTQSKAVHGGDFKGIEQKLDYIKSLGATAIWISPVVKNTLAQYHGYSGWDFYSTAPHLGALSDLQHMVNAAHARGIQVIDDIVLNHGGDIIYSTDSGYPNYKAPPGYTMKFRTSQQYPPPFDLNATNPTIESLFHNNGSIADFSDATQVVIGDLRGLDDLKTETTYVRNSLVSIYKYWIEQAGFDAFRIDTTKHVDHGCWQYWCPQLHADAARIGKPNFFMFGEIEDGSDTNVGGYTGIKAGGNYEQDSAVDYPLYFLVNGVFAQANANTKQLEDHFNATASAYDVPAQNRLVTFLDNHDHPRFLSSSNANNNLARLKVALAFLYTAKGIPCLYYGTEQAFNGSGDPNNREDMFAGGWEPGASVGDNFNETHPEFQLVAKLNNCRRLYPAMSLGSYVNQWNSPSGPGLFAYARRLGGQEVFVVFNTASTTQTLSARSTIYPGGTQLVNLLDTSEIITVTSTPQIPAISVPGTTAKIFIAQSQMQTLDPVVTAITPAHDAANVATTSAVTLTFSRAMNINSVQNAFSTTPATTGTFQWSPTNNALTYTPNGGWPGTTLMNVRIAPTATDATTGKQLYAAFEARFTTGAPAADTTPPVVALNSPSDLAKVTGAIAISGQASDNVAMQRVEVSLDGGNWFSANGTTSWSYPLDTTNFANGSHTIAARAVDTSNNISTIASVQVRFVNVPGAYVRRIAPGNSTAVVDCTSATWTKDQPYALGSFGYAGGTSAFVANAISGACAESQPLYQGERNAPTNSTFSYLFDAPPGVYSVTLLEAETSATGANQRVFNVDCNGARVLPSFDIFAASGGANVANTQSWTTMLTDGQLEIDFGSTTGNARSSGIQVQKTAEIFSDTDGIPDWWRLAYFDHATGSDADLSRATDDRDGDGKTNLDEYLSGTDPLDASSALRVTNIVVSGADVQITWNSVAGKTYQLQSAASLDPNATWSNVGAAVTANAANTSQTDTGGAGSAPKFYRVELL